MGHGRPFTGGPTPPSVGVGSDVPDCLEGLLPAPVTRSYVALPPEQAVRRRAGNKSAQFPTATCCLTLMKSFGATWIPPDRSRTSVVTRPTCILKCGFASPGADDWTPQGREPLRT